MAYTAVPVFNHAVSLLMWSISNVCDQTIFLQAGRHYHEIVFGDTYGVSYGIRTESRFSIARGCCSNGSSDYFLETLARQSTRLSHDRNCFIFAELHQQNIPNACEMGFES